METQTRMLTVVDWILPGTLVLSLAGHLDERACRYLARHIAELQSRWPGIRVTLDLSGVSSLDLAPAEALMLGLITRRAGEGELVFACPSLACLGLLRRLNIDFALHLAVERPLAGVTA